MHEKNRYSSLLFIIDTCQASSMVEFIHAPNIISIASSLVGESSYSHHVDVVLGVPVIDRFTDHMLTFINQVSLQSNLTCQDFVSLL
jgi:phosphatidylinositol glycan class K